MSEIEDAARDQVQQSLGEASDRRGARDASAIAVLVALVATIMAICNIKDGNVVQAMSMAQAKVVDTWSYYQAKSTKQHIAEASLEQAQLQLLGASAPGQREALAQAIARYQEQVKKYDSEKAQIKTEAEGYQAEYDRLNVHDDQFDLAEACFSVSLALFGIAALVRKRWLIVFAGVLSSIGLLFGIAGFAQWNLHPDLLARFLG